MQRLVTYSFSSLSEQQIPCPIVVQTSNRSVSRTFNEKFLNVAVKVLKNDREGDIDIGLKLDVFKGLCQQLGNC